MDKRYAELMKERPELFENLQGGVCVLSDEKDISEIEKRLDTRIGVIYEDEYVVFLKDAVRFPDGETSTYIRMYHKNAGGVAILPVFKGKLLLLQHFRHSLRKWIWETPRGFCDAGESNLENARRELKEELGTADFVIGELGQIVPDAGIIGETVTLYYAILDDNAKLDLERHEGIKGYSLLAKDEVFEKLKNGEISDSITISSVTQAVLKGIL